MPFLKTYMEKALHPLSSLKQIHAMLILRIFFLTYHFSHPKTSKMIPWRKHILQLQSQLKNALAREPYVKELYLLDWYNCDLNNWSENHVI